MSYTVVGTGGTTQGDGCWEFAQTNAGTRELRCIGATTLMSTVVH